MKATIALIVLGAACGPAGRAPAPVIANHAPLELDAGAAAVETDASDEQCTKGDPITVRVAKHHHGDAVRGDAWEKVHEVESNVIEASIAKDRRVATVGTCAMNDAGAGAGSGGGA